MGTISYQAKSGTWSGDIILNYTAEYDLKNNGTKITFADCRVEYSSAIGYESRTTTTITIKDQSGGKHTLTLSTYLASSDAGGGSMSFVAEPNPASVIVGHPDGTGQKTVEISAYTEFSLVAYAGEDRMNIKSDTASASLTTATLYTLTLDKGAGTNLVVDLYSSPFREPFSGFNSGAIICAGEVIRVWGSASSSAAYENFVMNVSGVGNVSTGTTVPVNGNITVKTTAQLKSYTLTVNADAHSLVTVKRGTKTLTSGAKVSHFDVLSVKVSAKSGYKVSTAKINGTAISPDTAVSHTVSGPVTVTAAAKPLSNLFLDDGGTRRRVLLYIDDNGERALYRAVFR